MKIGVTGADGLLGWHVRALLRVRGNHEVSLANRATFSTPERLAEWAVGLEGVIHLAGMNRGADEEIEAVNPALARALVAALDRAGAKPAIVYSNSIHCDRDTPYGRGKRGAASVLEAWANRTGAPFADLVFPHIFGEHGKPFYNSVVSTFCHQLARRESPAIVVDAELELLHAQDAAARCLAAVETRESGTARVRGTLVTVSALLERLRALDAAYRGQLVPELRTTIDVQLFNTLRSYLYPEYYPVQLDLHTDPRGALFEVIKSRGGGQTFLSTTRPGITRGNHFHTRKIERFLVASGEAKIHLRRLFSTEVREFAVSGDKPCYIDMPTFHTHSITNTGAGELVTLFWSNEVFDPADPDTYAEPVHV